MEFYIWFLFGRRDDVSVHPITDEQDFEKINSMWSLRNVHSLAHIKRLAKFTLSFGAHTHDGTLVSWAFRWVILVIAFEFNEKTKHDRNRNLIWSLQFFGRASWNTSNGSWPKLTLNCLSWKLFIFPFFLLLSLGWNVLRKRVWFTSRKSSCEENGRNGPWYV